MFLRTQPLSLESIKVVINRGHFVNSYAQTVLKRGGGKCRKHEDILYGDITNNLNLKSIDKCFEKNMLLISKKKTLYSLIKLIAMQINIFGRNKLEAILL